MAEVEGIAGRTVEQLWFWADTVRFVLSTAGDVEPDVYVDVGRFRFHDGEAVIDCDFGSNPLSVSPVLGTKGAVVEFAREEAGTLWLEFADGRRIECAPDESYEAWQVVSSEGPTWLAVCMPGGEVATWSRPT